MKSALDARPLLWAILSIPAVLIVYGYATDAMGYGQVLHVTGELSVRLLIVTMAISMLRLAFPRAGWTAWMIRRRREFGLASFGYALLHLVVYLLHKASLDLIAREGVQADLLVGWISFALFTALAVTSNDASVRWLRQNWRSLHRLVYPAAVLALLHWLLAAFEPRGAIVHCAILAVIEAIRLVLVRVRARPARAANA